MVKKKCFFVTGLLLSGLSSFNYAGMQKKEPLIYFKWAGGQSGEQKLSILARLQDTNQKILEEKTLRPGEAIMYNSGAPLTLYLKKDEFYSKLSPSWSGPFTLEPNRPAYGRYTEPNFELLIECDPSTMSCPANNKTSLALQ